MKRKIILIDEERCTGCGDCIPNCPEGALQIIDGKARLVSDLLCDGLGACVGECPTGALTIVEREAEPYDERKVIQSMIQHGPNTIKAHLKHLEDHKEFQYLAMAKEVLMKELGHIPGDYEKPVHGRHGGGCPGSRAQVLKTETPKQQDTTGQVRPQQSELRQWPIQLQLLNPYAPFFDNADLLVTADCVPFTFPDFHQRFLKGKILIVFCPKLDTTLQQYVEKLTVIFQEHEIKSITIVRMEVPCCYGTVRIVEEALKAAKKNIIIKDNTISLRGEII